MNLSKYEAAAFYDYTLSKPSSPKEYLILDLDECSFAFCTCSGKREIQQNESWSDKKENLWKKVLEALLKDMPENTLDKFEEATENQIISANQALRNYFLSDRLTDGKAFEFSEYTISCSELEQLCSGVKEKLNHLLSQALSRKSEEKMEDIGIILLGKAQELLLIPHWIKERVSFDPMLPDDRFRNDGYQIPYTQIVNQGIELYKSMAEQNHAYRFTAFNGKTKSPECIYEIPKEKQLSDRADSEFSRPILIWDGEPIRIQVDDSLLEITLPYAIGPAGNDLIEIAISQKNNENILLIRQSRFPSKVHQVKLSKKILDPIEKKMRNRKNEQ